MRFPTAKFTEIAKTSILIILILNFFIIFFEIRHIEYIYLVIFLLLNFLLNIIIIENYKNTYERLKAILKAERILFKHKILILLGSVIIGYFSLIFIQKINIKLSLKFFKEIVKIFFISAIIYYLPIASVQLGKFFYMF